MVRFGKTEFVKNDFFVQFECIKFQTFKPITIRHAWEKPNFNFYNFYIIKAVYAGKNVRYSREITFPRQQSINFMDVTPRQCEQMVKYGKFLKLKFDKIEFISPFEIRRFVKEFMANAYHFRLTEFENEKNPQVPKR